MTDTRKIAEEIVKKYSVGFRPNEELIDDIENVLTDMRNKTIRECVARLHKKSPAGNYYTNPAEVEREILSLLSEPEKGEK